jgi:hypothetical protein
MKEIDSQKNNVHQNNNNSNQIETLNNLLPKNNNINDIKKSQNLVFSKTKKNC